MFFTTLLPLAMLGLAGTSSASPTTSATPEQTAAFYAALESYYSSFKSSPEFTSLGFDLALNVPASVLSSLEANPAAVVPVETTSLNLYSIATDPPLTFATPSWEATLAPNLVSDIRAAQTSAIIEVAEIAQSVLSVTQSITVPTSSSSSSSGNAAPALRATNPAEKAIGAVVAAFGVAAILL